MISAPVIDQEAIDNLRALNPDDDSFLREIVGIFLEDTPLRIAELKQSVTAVDQTAFTRAAHSIKGSSSNLGAERLRSLAEVIEHGSKNADWATFSNRIPDLEQEFAEAKRELERLL